eukprot:2203723-Amphidinium_carterae.1
MSFHSPGGLPPGNNTFHGVFLCFICALFLCFGGSPPHQFLVSQKTGVSVGVPTPLVETTICCGASSLPCLRLHVCSAFLSVFRPGLARDRSAGMAGELAEGMPDFDVEEEVQPGAALSGGDAADPQ